MRRIKHFLVAVVAAGAMVMATAPSLHAEGFTVCYTVWWYTVCDYVEVSSGGEFMQTMYALCQFLGLCP